MKQYDWLLDYDIQIHANVKNFRSQKFSKFFGENAFDARKKTFGQRHEK